jgi:hypothetical protein
MAAKTKRSARKSAAKKAVKKAVPKPAKKAVAKAAKVGKGAASASPIARLRKICLSLPEATEVEAWGAPTFRVRGKIFAMYAGPGNHHHDGREGVWMLSISIEQDMVIRARPDKYFKPPYVGPSGWIGAYLDRNPPWAEIEELLRDAWRRRAPKKIAALLD